MRLDMLAECKLAFANTRPEPAPGLFWGGWLGTIAVSIVLTHLLPPFRRAGRTLGCKPVKLSHRDVQFNNRHFASLAKTD